MTQILVVEDDPDLRVTLRQALTAAGYAVDTAPDGQAALAALVSRSYALMVLDLGLPQMDGLDVLRRLRAGQNSVPVLVLTARDGLEHRVLGLKLGADDYLAKPVTASTVVETLQRGEKHSDVRSSAPRAEPMSPRRLEWEHIQRVLAEHAGNLSATARALKMHRRTLQRKLAKKPLQG
jgi:two-component system, response regulator RegA